MTVNELKAQRAKEVADARSIINAADADKRELTAEENQTVDRHFNAADELAKQIEKAERVEKLEKAEAELRHVAERKTNYINRKEPTDADRKEALRAWALGGTGTNTADRNLKADMFGISPAARSLEVRALSKGTNSAGGYTVPVDFASTYEKKLAYFCPLRQHCPVFTTASGADLDYPRVSDTANSASIVSEAGNIGVATDPTFDKVTFKSWKWASPIVKVSVELLQDSAIDIEALLAGLFAERMGRGQGVQFMQGDGTTEPEGLITGASVAVNLASGNAMTGDKLIDLYHACDIAYRSSPSAKFLMHDATAASIRKLKSSDNQYLWQPGLSLGQPDRLLGHPVIIDNNLTSFASPGDNQPLILFGDLSKYMIRDVASSLVMSRLDELYAANGQVGFVLLQRTDGRYVGHTGCVVALNSYDAP